LFPKKGPFGTKVDLWLSGCYTSAKAIGKHSDLIETYSDF